MHISDAAKPMFAHHETFHLRYGWLKKAYDLIIDDPRLFQKDDAPVQLGVGKNMVKAIKFWSLATKIMKYVPNPKSKKAHILEPTDLGHKIFDTKHGLDPYLEKLNTLWLLDWLLYAPPSSLPVWWIIMNEFSVANIKTAELTDSVIQRMQNIPGWKSPNPNSIKKDIDVFIHTYTSRQDKLLMEDYLDCPFRQLHMLKQSSRDTMRFVFGKKYGLTPMVVAFASLDFIDRAGISGKSISVTRLATEQGSVGNIFKINETDLAGMLTEACEPLKSVRMTNVNEAPYLTFTGSPHKASMQVLSHMYGKPLHVPKSKYKTEELVAQ